MANITGTTGSLAYGAQLPLSLTNFIQQLIRRGPNFQPAQQAYSQQYSHPSLRTGPNGGWLDPMQANEAAGAAYLDERGQAAGENINNQNNLAGLLTKGGGQYASLINSIPFLQASNIGSSSSGSPLSIFGGGY